MDRKENRKNHPNQQQNQNCSSVKGLHTQFSINIIDPHHPKQEHKNQGGKGRPLYAHLLDKHLIENEHTGCHAQGKVKKTAIQAGVGQNSSVGTQGQLDQFR